MFLLAMFQSTWGKKTENNQKKRMDVQIVPKKTPWMPIINKKPPKKSCFLGYNGYNWVMLQNCVMAYILGR